MIRKIRLLFDTVRYLKARQIIFQIYYRIRRVKSLSHYYRDQPFIPPPAIRFSDYLPAFDCATVEQHFTFLNQTVGFERHIDWDHMALGKLWNYNLHYANYLLQENIPLTLRLQWLDDLHRKLFSNSKGLEPYPVSLRLINTIRLIIRHNISDKHIWNRVKAEAEFLSRRLEYHLLGNHLLENAFALLLAGAFFNNTRWSSKARSILGKELKEQILNDGAHFELSPMYHQIILYRVLELIDWYKTWDQYDRRQMEFYRRTAGKMLGWLRNMTFSNGDIPHFNDSSDGIAYTSNQLFSYADHLGIPADTLPLKDSGYRSFRSQRYECKVDAAPVGPSYQPGHAHADALSFILYLDGQPFLVETGTSTYQAGAQRSAERSTAAHNTVVVDGRNQSEVWGAFRVGKRARTVIHDDAADRLTASHNGYLSSGITHIRSFSFEEKAIIIRDQFTGMGRDQERTACFHFHPRCSIELKGNEIFTSSGAHIRFENGLYISHEKYKFAAGFNLQLEGSVLKVSFQENLNTLITLIN